MSDSSPSPAEELRTAAEKLRNTADMATPGPWSYGGLTVGLGIRKLAPGEYTLKARLAELVDEDDREDYRVRVDIGGADSDGEWMAMMSPALARPLSAWLDDTASDIDSQHGRIKTSTKQYALDIARAINGGAA